MTSRISSPEAVGDDPRVRFERLYAEAERGAAAVPWDRDAPHSLLAEWTDRTRPDGVGRRALVVGCGFGRDAEHLARLGFATVAFDISPTAVRTARRRHAGSPVRYETADLLDPPAAWLDAFDLVLESMNVQAGAAISNNWSNFDVISSPGDFSGDGKPDVIAR
ncbi:class I SAM-dependent methyltransferase, partial [Micromonospora sp. NPDC003776]